MRTRKEIETSGARVDVLSLEVLLDIRDMIIAKQTITIAPDVIPEMGKIIPELGIPEKKTRRTIKHRKKRLGGGLKTPTNE
jgi:hypothetical protein